MLPMSAFERFRGLSDDDWRAAILASAENPQVVELPGFPPPNVQRQLNGQLARASLGPAYDFYRLVKAEVRKHIGELHPHTRMLDFGAGWGRITRYFLKDIAPGNLMAVDVAPTLRSLWSAMFTDVPFYLNDLRPPMDPAVDELDVVYAHSVFSHMAKANADEWSMHIAKRLRPNGLFILTTVGAHNLEPRHSDSILRGWADNPAPFEEAMASGQVFHQDTAPDQSWGWTAIPESYVRREWSRDFAVLSYTADPNIYKQAVFVLRRI